MSSANRLILWVDLAMVKPFISGQVRIYMARGSISRLKIKGDRGQPCLVPFVMLNGLDSAPDVNTRAEVLEYRARIADNILPVKQKFI